MLDSPVPLYYTFLIVIGVIKVRLSPSKKICFICFNGSFLTAMKNAKILPNAKYFILKVIFVLKIFKFLSFWSCRKNGLIRKTRLISELMTLQPD